MAPKSSYQFVDYIIRKSILLQTKSVTPDKLNIKIIPSGIINKETSQFQLFLELIVSEEGEKPFINVEVIGLFKYQGNVHDVKNFLFMNSSALLFPYIRAYITSLTALSGQDALTLPTMNLTSMKDELEENTVFIDSSEEE